MKRIMVKILEKKLRFLAKRIIKKYQPDIIGVTGSVGKTSAKEAVFKVLSGQFSCRRSLGNYNNEIGVPLTIIGAPSGKKSLFGWLKVFCRALRLMLINSSYPKILILEMGADKPGDLEYLTNFIPLKVGIVTAIAPVHTEFFKTLENIAREKSRVITCLPKDGFALINADDELVRPMKEKTEAAVSTYGLSKEAEVRATEIKLSYGEINPMDGLKRKTVRGLSFKVQYSGSTAPFYLPGVLGEHQVYTALAATAVGLAYGLNLISISEQLKSFKSPAGRMNVIQGIKHTLIIDDSYNSSPQAALAALAVLEKINLGEDIPGSVRPPAIEKLPRGGRRFLKFACLGEMAELGEFTEQGHALVGQRAAGVADILITVGEKAKTIAKEALKRGMHEMQIFSFDFAEEVGRFLQDRIHKGDIILVKGSQVSRMEKVVKEIMAEPRRADELLVRQGIEWQKK